MRSTRPTGCWPSTSITASRSPGGNGYCTSPVRRRTERTGLPFTRGDIVAQFQLAWSNLKDALAAADMDPGHVVRLNMYTTDVDAFMAAAGDLVPIYAQDGCKPACTLLGVDRLFQPELMIELEATAVA